MKAKQIMRMASDWLKLNAAENRARELRKAWTERNQTGGFFTCCQSASDATGKVSSVQFEIKLADYLTMFPDVTPEQSTFTYEGRVKARMVYPPKAAGQLPSGVWVWVTASTPSVQVGTDAAALRKDIARLEEELGGQEDRQEDHAAACSRVELAKLRASLAEMEAPSSEAKAA